MELDPDLALKKARKVEKRGCSPVSEDLKAGLSE
jgi:hypothetical protein